VAARAQARLSDAAGKRGARPVSRPTSAWVGGRDRGESWGVTDFGYTMMCEQAAPDQLVRDVRRAEEVGFDF
jgi:hypothetical protein